jgi:hypothetical protein
MQITDASNNLEQQPKYVVSHKGQSATVSLFDHPKMILNGTPIDFAEAETLLKVLSKAIEIGHVLQKGVAL